jgi:ABC-type branched-subunit amino acid transport system substrate-binding protein
MGTRSSVWAAVAIVTAAGSMLATGAAPAGASSPADQGVTAKTISLGVPYVNFAALKSLGVTIDDGSFPDAYNAIVKDINAHGGVNGRKIDLHLVEMNPSLPADAASSCAQLTEDDKVFVSISPVFPDCYQQTHDTPVIAGSLPGALPASAAPDFALIPPDAAFDSYQLATFAKRGVFKGKKVGIFYGATSDAPEVKAVQADLKNLHVPVVATAEDSAPATDSVASDQETQTIGLRFKSDGVNVVIGVGGSGSTTWPRAQLDLQSTYKPTYIATSESSLISYVQSTKGKNPYLDNVLAATSVPNAYQQWKDPAIKKCAAVVHKAYPSDTITPPVNPNTQVASTDTTYQSVIEACQYLGLFTKIADATGKHLTVASFTKAGYGLKNATIPGMGGPISFGPHQPYAVGPVTVVSYDPKTQTLVPASSTSK